MVLDNDDLLDEAFENFLIASAQEVLDNFSREELKSLLYTLIEDDPEYRKQLMRQQSEFRDRNRVIFPEPDPSTQQ